MKFRYLSAAAKKYRRRSYSNLGEESHVNELLARDVGLGGVCVDVGASDGKTMSNTDWLFNLGWSGLAVEGDGGRFGLLANRYRSKESVRLVFDFLSLDIDGYDYHVLGAILKEFRPNLICCEVNEKIPPPLRFSVNFDEDYSWGSDHFFGQSLAQVDVLAKDCGYSLLRMHYNNAFLVPKELAGGREVSVEAAYRIGYVEKKDRLSKFPWNAEMEPLLTMEPAVAVEYLRERFEPYSGQYTLDY
jgi:hypothetical protein